MGGCVLVPVIRFFPEEPIKFGPRGHGHDEGSVHESVGWTGHRPPLPGTHTHTYTVATTSCRGFRFGGVVV